MWKKSGGDAVVGLDEAAESFATANRAMPLGPEVRIEDAVADILAAMWPFGQVMLDPRTDDIVHLPEREHREVVEGFGLEPADEGFAIGVCLHRQMQRMRTMDMKPSA